MLWKTKNPQTHLFRSFYNLPRLILQSTPFPFSHFFSFFSFFFFIVTISLQPQQAAAMPATNEYQGGSFLGRISIRRNQVVSMEGNHEQELEDIDLFQKNVAERFSDLKPPPPPDSSTDSSAIPITAVDTILSVPWLRKLLDNFLCCEAEFKAVLIMGRDPSHISKPPLDRLIPEMLDRSVKALDVCNAISHGLESVRHLQKLAEIVVTALQQRPFGEGQIRRAKKALGNLNSTISMDDKDSHNFKATERSKSLGRRGGNISGGGSGKDYRISWGVSKNWSASKQIQAMANNLVAPRGNEASGLALPVYIMSSVTVFAMWVLVAAIPCRDRTGLSPHFPVPRQLGWAQSMIGIQERISEEWKKKEKKGSAGLMEEIQRMEKLVHLLIEFTDSFQFPLEVDKEDEITVQVSELAEICKSLEEGLVPFQHQLREVFHRIVRSRSEILELLDHAGKSSTPIM